MESINKTLPGPNSPLLRSLIGSIVFHCVLIACYGLILIPERSEPPKPPEKFKIEMVKRNPRTQKKVDLKKTTLKRPEEIAPAKMRRLKVVSLKQPFKPTKSKEPLNPPIAIPRQTRQIEIREKPSQNYRPRLVGKINLTTQPPLPKPIKNMPSTPTSSGRQVKLHKSSPRLVHFSRKAKPLNAPVTSTKIVVSTRTIQVRENSKSLQSYKSLPVLNPKRSTSISSTSSGKVIGIHETKAHPASNLPSAVISSTALGPRNTIGKTNKAKMVQKIESSAVVTIPSPRPVPEVVDQRIFDKYLNTLQVLIASTKQYPESARKSGMEGKAVVQFTVMKNGKVKNIRLVSKTNHPYLDEEAVNAVKRAAPFSNFPDEISKSFLEIVLPFRFKLNE